MDISIEQMHVPGHNFLDTIDLDVMEQTIIDDVMAEISTTEQVYMSDPVIPRNHSDSLTSSVFVPEAVVPVSTIARSQSEPVMKDVIEASDVEALLAQFEEAANDISTPVSNSAVINVPEKPPVFTLQTEDEAPSSKDTNGIVAKKELTNEVLQKLKASRKPKTTVMLPMVVPAKRGRGRAMTRGHPVAMPANCTPRRLQRVMMQNTELKDSLALMEVVEVKDGSNRDLCKERKMESLLKKSDVAATKVEAAVVDKVNGSNSEENEIASALKNGPEVKKKVEKVTVDENYFEHVSDHDYVRSVSSGVEEKYDKKNVDDFEEGEIPDEESSYNERDAHDRNSKCREEDSDNSHLFDKLPSYYTALSIPRKRVKKTASCLTGRGGITIQDYIQRDISPDRDTSTYNKLPDYFSSFTNSTRYDSINEDKVPKFSDDSKASSGYSSLTHSPNLSKRSSRSRSNSNSRSRSVSHSKSVHKSQTRRPSSYSPYSGYSSSGSSCSRSSYSNRSCCSSRSRSRSSDSSMSGSSSCSTCSSRSSSVASRSPSRSPTRSPERSWRRERNIRGERTRRTSSPRLYRSPRHVRRDRSRSRSNRYSHTRSRSRGYRSRSRSRSAYRRRSVSKERFREERKKQREEEKQQQMKERRIVYVGGLPNGYSRHTLRDLFTRFGPIEHVQLHFREHGDNYGFVTFTYTCDAYAAIEKGRNVPGLEKFDLCFGGRRQFCDVEYADLDGNKEIEEEFDSKPQKSSNFDFDELLRQAKAKIKKS